MTVKYDIKEWLKVLPDEEIYLVSSKQVCKNGDKLLFPQDSGFNAAAKKGESFRRALHEMNPIRRFVCYWYMKYPNQSESICIDGIYDFFREIGLTSFEEDLYTFGIYDSQTNKTLSSKGRTYIVKVEGTSKDEIENNISSYIIDNLPEAAYELKDDKVYIYDEEVGLTTDVHLYLNGDIQNLPLTGIKELLSIPNLNLSNRTIYNVTKDEIRKSNFQVALNKPLEFYRSGGLETVDITQEIEQLTNALYNGNIRTYKLLCQLIDITLNKVNEVGGPDKAIVYSLVNNNIYIYYCVCLKYLYNISCVNLDMKYKYNEYLANLYYSKHRMLAGDKLLYLRDFPTNLVYNTRFGMLIFVTTDINITLAVTKIEIDSNNELIGDPINDIFDISDRSNEIINITDLFDFNNDTYVADNSLKHLFLDFYHRIKDSDLNTGDFPNPCNTFITAIDGRRYLVRLNKFSTFLIKGLLNHIEMQTQMEASITDESELRKWVPMELYNDENIGEIMISRFIKKSNYPREIKRVYARRSSDLLTLYYRFFFENDGIPGGVEDIPNSFIASNLNVSGSVDARADKLWETLFHNADELIEQLTSFYCHDPRVVTEITISESMLINKYML